MTKKISCRILKSVPLSRNTNAKRTKGKSENYRKGINISNGRESVIFSTYDCRGKVFCENQMESSAEFLA